MRELFVTYEQALALNKLGFNEECLTFYYNKELAFGSRPDYGEVVEAPLKQQAFTFFREEYSLWSYVYPYINDKDWGFHIQFYDSNMWGEIHLGNKFKTYEEAENACIDKSIELCKQKHNE